MLPALALPLGQRVCVLGLGSRRKRRSTGLNNVSLVHHWRGTDVQQDSTTFPWFITGAEPMLSRTQQRVSEVHHWGNCAQGPQVMGHRVPLQGEELAQVQDPADQRPTGVRWVPHEMAYSEPMTY